MDRLRPGFERPARFLGQPYPPVQVLGLIYRHLAWPVRTGARAFSWVLKRTVLNRISPVCRLAFAGDVMPLRGRRIGIAPALHDFLADADVLVANLEGVLPQPSARGLPPLSSLAQDADIFAFLSALFPPDRTVLGMANNHAADFGRSAFAATWTAAQRHGFRVFGSREIPRLRVDAINIAACSAWSNQPCTFIPGLAEADGLRDPTAHANILLPHWGFEMQLYPGAQQVRQGRAWLADWDLVVGAHPHCPQPLCTEHDRPGTHPRQLIAYSLGDVAFGTRNHRYHDGILLKVALGPMACGRWAVGEVCWEFLTLARDGDGLQLRFTAAPAWV